MKGADDWLDVPLDDVPPHGEAQANGAAGEAKAKARPLPPLTPAEWLARDIPDTDWLLGSLFATTTRAVLSADTGLGKTMFGLAVAFAMATGRDFLHWRAHRPARVLYVDGEMPAELIRERIRAACKWFEIEPPTDGLMLVSREDVEEMPPLDTAEGQQWLDAFMHRLGHIDFAIFDNLMALSVLSLAEEEGWQALKPYVLSLTRRRIGQLWLHHTGHDKSRGFGIKAREWHMDTVMVGEKLIGAGDTDVAFKLSFPKCRRRTPDNRADFAPADITLQGSECNRGESPGGGVFPTLELAPAK